MSEQVETPVRDSAPGSLHSRMRARASELEKQRTEIFPVPGYAELLHVELMALSWETMRKIAERNERVGDPATRELYIASDQLIAATVRFHEVDGEGERREVEASWQTLAHGVVDNFSQDGTPRQAVIALLGHPTSRLIFFWQEFLEWANSERSSINEEIAQDFGTTR